MSNLRIEFSTLASQQMEDIADYLYQQNLSKKFVLDYLNKFENWLEVTLCQFPESGMLMPEYGKDIRRVVYQKYSFIYRLNGNVIEILTVYRENLP